MKQDPDIEFEDAALRSLRETLNNLGVHTETSDGDGDSEWFRAFISSHDNGDPCCGLFIVSHQPGGNGGARAEFSWGRHDKHPMTDIPGAAQRIQQTITDQQTPDCCATAPDTTTDP